MMTSWSNSVLTSHFFGQKQVYKSDHKSQMEQQVQILKKPFVLVIDR